MLQNIVQPPLVVATELKPQAPDRRPDKDFKGSGSETSFGKALDDKMSKMTSKEQKETTPKEVRGKDEKPEKPEAKKADQEVAKPEGQNAKKAVVRQQAIKEFMDSFESEFEISPTRLVEAMAQLDDTQLVQSPEATAEAVIAQLQLDDSQVEKASEMYAALLMQLQQAPVVQTPKTPEMMGAGVGAGLSQQQIQLRAADAQGKQAMMNSTIDRMNSQFWNKETAAQALPEGVEQSLLGQLNIDEASFEDITQAPAQEIPMAMEQVPQGPKLPELPPHLKGQMQETMSPALLAALAAKKAAQSAEESAGQEAPELMDEFTQALQPKTQEQPGQIGSQAMSAQQMKGAGQMMQQEAQGESFMQQNSQNLGQQQMAGEKESVAGKVETKSASFKQSLTGLENIHGAPLKGESLAPTVPMAPVAGAAMPAPGTPEQNEAAAVKQIMNQAQYLIKRGGGEMNVEMTPEGMGKIHLKVMLQDGKVNLQMAADTQDAKKAIESSLAELKTSLAAQKLSMENVKVDVVNATSTDTATQNQTNLNHGQRDQQTRQFWNQFNENFGSQGRRESFTEMPGLRSYGRRHDPLSPVDGSAPRTRAVEGKGSGLNLVA